MCSKPLAAVAMRELRGAATAAREWQREWQREHGCYHEDYRREAGEGPGVSVAVDPPSERVARRRPGPPGRTRTA